MKKLMITAAIVCAAVMTQAATVQWESGALMRAANDEGGWGTTLRNFNENLSISVFLIDSTTYEGLASKSQQEIYDTYSTKTADASNSTSTKTSTSINTQTAAEKGVSQYAVVLFNYSDLNTDSKFKDNTDFYMAKTAMIDGSKIDAADNTYKVQSIGSTNGSWSAAAVPEPTSGLLLLLGVAGLALRRRRA